MSRWMNLEPGCRTDDGYSLRKCDQWWIVVARRFDGDGLATVCCDLAGEVYFHEDGVDGETLLFESQRHTTVAARRYSAMTAVNCLPMSLGDYWRSGRVPPLPMRFLTSRNTVATLVVE